MTAVGAAIRRFFAAVVRDRGRVVWSFVFAIALWYLLGQKVLVTENYGLQVLAIGPLDTVPDTNALVVRVPKELAFVGAEPATVFVDVRGAREDLARLEGKLAGTFDVPADFCSGASERTKQFDITRTFAFPRLKSISNVDFVGPAELSLTCARRADRPVTLTVDNLEFDPPSLRVDLEAEFEPAFVAVSGPADDVARLEKEPARLKLATLDQQFVDAATTGKRSLPPELAWLESAGGKLQSGLLVNGGRPVQVSLRRRRAEHVVTIDNVEIAPLIPATAWREGANRADPVKLKEKVAKVTLKLSEEQWTTEFGGEEGQLRRQLSLFVNLRELVQSKVADRLKVRCEGVPVNATIVSIVPDAIDVEWNLSETPVSGGEKK